MTPVGLDQARSLAQGQQKLIMVNIQDTTEFDCQVLNRDVWKDESVQAMVKTNFIFLQYKNESTQGKQYISWYQVKGYPHIAILDPVTGILVFLLVNLADWLLGERLWQMDRLPTAQDFVVESIFTIELLASGAYLGGCSNGLFGKTNNYPITTTTFRTN